MLYRPDDVESVSMHETVVTGQDGLSIACLAGGHRLLRNFAATTATAATRATELLALATLGGAGGGKRALTVRKAGRGG